MEGKSSMGEKFTFMFFPLLPLSTQHSRSLEGSIEGLERAPLEVGCRLTLHLGFDFSMKESGAEVPVCLFK